MVEPLNPTTRVQDGHYASDVPKSSRQQHTNNNSSTLEPNAPTDSLQVSQRGELASQVLNAAHTSDGIDSTHVASIRAFLDQQDGSIDPELIAAGLLSSNALDTE